MLNKKYTKLSPRIIEHILQMWCGKLSQDGGWTKADSKIALMLENLKRDMYHDTYLRNKKKI